MGFGIDWDKVKKFNEENSEEIKQQNNKERFEKDLENNNYPAIIEKTGMFDVLIRTSRNKVFSVEVHNGFGNHKFKKGDKVIVGVSNNKHILFKLLPKEEKSTLDEQEKAFRELGGEY